jgi:two-component system, chemotaxis family, chemotaxis protein CheY
MGTIQQSGYGKKMSLMNLKEGQMLFNEIRGNNGEPLIPAKTILRQYDIDTLKRHGIEAAWVCYNEPAPDRSKSSVDPGNSRPQSGSGSNNKILIVDDVVSMRKNLRRILEEDGYHVVAEANDGDEAITLSKVLKPDLVMIDIFMERMNGIEATHEIRRDNPSIKVIILTQSAKPSLVTDSIHAGAINFIIKPYDANHVKRIVRNALK